jgi:outer membrane protein assembly factor BamB
LNQVQAVVVRLASHHVCGLTHCLDAKTGNVHWTYDTLAATYASLLIIGKNVYIADEDGDISIFRLSADPMIAMLNGAW